jgi:hypothetical protein
MAQAMMIDSVTMASNTPVMQGLSQDMRQCIQDCLECANICDQTMAYCLERGGRHVSAEHIKLLRDCEESCTFSASMMGRKSRFAAQHCQLCAIICGECAQSCEAMGDDLQMNACAEACRHCEQACRRMTTHGWHG